MERSWASIPEDEVFPISDAGCGPAEFECRSHADCGSHTGFRQVIEDISKVRQEQEQAIDALGSLMASVAEKCACTCWEMEESIRKDMREFKHQIKLELRDRCEELERRMLQDLVRHPKGDAEGVQGTCGHPAASSAGAGSVEADTTGMQSPNIAVGAPQGWQQSKNHNSARSYSSSQSCAAFIKQPSRQPLSNVDVAESAANSCGSEKIVPYGLATSVVDYASSTDATVASSRDCADHSPAVAAKQVMPAQASQCWNGAVERQQQIPDACSGKILFRSSSADVLGMRNRNLRASPRQRSLSPSGVDQQANLETNSYSVLYTPQSPVNPPRLVRHAAAYAAAASAPGRGSTRRLTAWPAEHATSLQSAQVQLKHSL